MLRSDTRAMGRVLDVIWYDLSVTEAMESAKYQIVENNDALLFGQCKKTGTLFVITFPHRFPKIEGDRTNT